MYVRESLIGELLHEAAKIQRGLGYGLTKFAAIQGHISCRPTAEHLLFSAPFHLVDH